MSQSTSVSQSTQAVTQAPSPSTVTPTQVAQQPYGNQAAQEDAGLVDYYSTMYLETDDEDIAYVELLGWAQVDFPTALATCLADPTRPSAQRWLAHYTIDDVAAEAPEMVDSVREIVWPVGRRIEASMEGGMTIEGFGGDVSGDVQTERAERGFSVELEGELAFGADAKLPEGMKKELDPWLKLMPSGPAAGSDVTVGFGLGGGAGARAGWKVNLGWELPTEVMDGVLGGVPCLPALDALLRSIDMLLEHMTGPDTVQVDQVIGAEASASAGLGAGAEAGAEAGLSFGYAVDDKTVSSHASISGGVSAGFDWGPMQVLLSDPALVDLAAEFTGELQARFEMPREKFPDVTCAKFFFCWSTTSGETSSSTWVEVGALDRAIEFLASLLGGDGGGVISVDALPDRTLVRSEQRPIEDEAQVEALSALIDRPGDHYGPEVRTSMLALGSLRVNTAAVRFALGSDEFDTAGESAEDALLDAERQIAGRFLGESYEWPGSRQLDGGLDLAVDMCEVAESRVEVTTEITREVEGEGEGEGEHHGTEFGVELGSSIAYTSVLEVPPEQLREFMCA